MFTVMDSREYEQFKKEYQAMEKKRKSCVGCLYEKGQPGDACGLASGFCVNSPTKPYYRAASETA